MISLPPSIRAKGPFERREVCPRYIWVQEVREAVARKRASFIQTIYNSGG